MNRGNAQLEALALKLAEVKNDDQILEIGFGNGQLLGDICNITTQGKVFGADISEDLIEQVSQKLNDSVRNKELELHVAGVSKLPFHDNSFDKIITNNTIYFWPEPVSDAQEILRVLKPGGKLICGFRTAEEMRDYPFVTKNPDIFKNHLTDSEVEELLLEAGFSAVFITVEKGDMAESHVAVATK